MFVTNTRYKETNYTEHSLKTLVPKLVTEIPAFYGTRSLPLVPYPEPHQSTTRPTK